MPNDQKSGNYLEVSNRTNQLQSVKDRRDLIKRRTWLVCKMAEKHTFPQEIDVIFCEEPSSSWGKERLVNTHDVINVSDSSQTRSAHASETFNVKDEIFRERRERSVAAHDVSHESLTVNEADLDFRIPGLPHAVVKCARRVPAFENWFRKFRTIQIDKHFNKIYDKINHLILFFQSRIQNKWFRMWVTSNHVNCSRRNPKRSAQCVYHTQTFIYFTARAGISCIKKEGPINNSSIIRWTFQSLSMSSRREDFMDIDMVKNRETNNIFTANHL